MTNLASPALAAPLTLAHGPAMANRFALAPLTNMQSHDDGTLGDDEYDWLTKRAAGGFAMVLTCAAHVSAAGKAFHGQLGIWSDAHLPGLTRLVAGLTAPGALAAVQLHHGGRRAAESGMQPVCPWDDAETGARALGTGEVEQVIEDFVAAAVRAERAGFSGAEVHAAHGYLVGQFLDGEHNHRTDGYGGSLEHRSRVLFAIIDGIRERCGPDFQLGVRISPERFGIKLAEAQRTAERIMQCGKVDYLDLSLWDCFKEPNEPAYAGRRLIDLFTGLPRAGCRLGVAGHLMDGPTTAACLEAGADFVMIGRGAILHHDFPRRVMADAAFAAVPRPVSRDYLRSEGVGPRFMDYLATWDGFVAD